MCTCVRTVCRVTFVCHLTCACVCHVMYACARVAWSSMWYVRVCACVVCVRVWFLKPMIITIRSCAGWHWFAGSVNVWVSCKTFATEACKNRALLQERPRKKIGSQIIEQIVLSGKPCNSGNEASDLQRWVCLYVCVCMCLCLCVCMCVCVSVCVFWGVIYYGVATIRRLPEFLSTFQKRALFA